MKLVIEPRAKEWLSSKGFTSFTIQVLVSSGGGCCSGSFKETVVDLGEPKDKRSSYIMYEQGGIKAYIANIIVPVTQTLKVSLKGVFFKRLDISGYEPKIL